LDLIEKLNHNAKPDENILVSPLSIYEALALLHLGSDGETKKELSKVLGFQGSDSE
jgi:serine protease inhibitor